MKYLYTFITVLFLLLFSGCFGDTKQGVVIELADNKFAVSELLKFDVANYTDEVVFFETCPSPYFLEMKEGDSFNDLEAREKRKCRTIPLQGQLKPGDKAPFEVPFNWVRREGMKTGKYRLVFVYNNGVEKVEEEEDIEAVEKIEEEENIEDAEKVEDVKETEKEGLIDIENIIEVEEKETFEVNSDIFELLAIEGVTVTMDNDKYKNGDEVGFTVLNNNPIPIFFNACESEYFLEEKKGERGYNRVWFSGKDLPQCENSGGSDVKIDVDEEVRLEIDTSGANFSDISSGVKPMRVFFMYYVKKGIFEKSAFIRGTSEAFEIEFQ